jgi:hypothetical protein
MSAVAERFGGDEEKPSLTRTATKTGTRTLTP